MTYSTQIIKAPFDRPHIKALKKRQSGTANRYICPEHSSNDRYVLEPEEKGLICPECAWTMDWSPREIQDDKKKKKAVMGLDKKEVSPAVENPSE